MKISQFSHLTTTWGALDKSLLDEKRFIYLFNCTGIISNSGGDCSDSHRSTIEFINDREQYFIVDFIQPMFVNVKRFERIGRNGPVNTPVALHLCKVTHPSQKGVG